MGTKKEAGGDVVSRTAGGSEPEAFVGFSSSQNCCSTKGAVGKVPFAAKSGLMVQVAEQGRLRR
jgi:hypothetical protein